MAEIIHDYQVSKARSIWTIYRTTYFCPHCDTEQTPETECLDERGYYVRTCLMRCHKCKQKYQYSA